MSATQNPRRELIRRLSEDSMGGIATLSDVTEAEQLVDAYRLTVIGERDAQTIEFLVKKAREEGRNNRDCRTRGDVLFRMADKISRGAIRPPLSSASARLLTDAERYPGELAMLRGLAGVLRVVAEHSDDMAEVRRLLAEHAADEQDAYARGGDDRG